MSVKPKIDRKTGRIIPGVWMIDYRPEGRNGTRRQRLFGSVEEPRTESEALALYMDLVRLARRKPLSSINPKFADLLPDYKEEYRNHHEASTVRDLENCLVHLVKFFGKLYLAEVTPALIEQYKSQRLAAVIPPPQRKGEEPADYQRRLAETPPRHFTKRTINKELAYLSGFLKWCSEPERNYCTSPPKVKSFPARQTTAPRARPLHPQEVDALLQHLEPCYRLVFLLYNDTGLRRAEVLGGGKYEGLRGQDVDLNFNVLYIRGKGDKERIMPITTARLRAELVAALAEIKKRPAPKTEAERLYHNHLAINPATGKPWHGIRKALLRAAVAAGIDRRVYHHLLRHNFGTHALAAGMSLRTVQELMGHSTSKTTEIYTHMGAYLQQEAAKLARYIEPTTEDDDTTPPDRTK